MFVITFRFGLRVKFNYLGIVIPIIHVCITIFKLYLSFNRAVKINILYSINMTDFLVISLQNQKEEEQLRDITGHPV